MEYSVSNFPSFSTDFRNLFQNLKKNRNSPHINTGFGFAAVFHRFSPFGRNGSLFDQQVFIAKIST
jgi:hypothetical protein